MIVTANEIYLWMDKWAPFDTAAAYDNAGFLVGDRNAQISSVAVVFDITVKAVEQAAALGCQLMISHHPVIFTAIKSIDVSSPVYRLIQNGIGAVCAHTNLDAAVGGVNDVLADLLGLTGVIALADPDEPMLPPPARIGTLPHPMKPLELAAYVRDKLGAGGVRYTECTKEISSVAVCGGSGAEFIQPAINEGADALITGEAKHHELLYANDHNFMLIDAGHFITERRIVNEVAKRLKNDFKDLTVCVIEQEEPVKYIVK